MEDVVMQKARIIWFDVWDNTGSLSKGVLAAQEYIEKKMRTYEK